MEFKSLRNIESSFRQIRLFGIVFLSLCAVVTVWSVWNSCRFAEKQREKIYVLDNGKSLMLALSQDLSQNRPAEAREHVRRFHEMFFTLSPEKSAIEHNVKRALLLADKSVYHYYSDFAEKGYYNRIIAGNINPAGTLLQGTPEKIEREGKKAIKDAAPGGGYIYWTGCDWPLDVPLANVEAFFDTAKKYGRYPINIPEER